MHFIDITIFLAYMLGMLGIGVYFLKKNSGTEDYYVGGRQMGSWHIGLSVVATDVGGGFSIGLGGLGFLMGLSGSWMLFTGLLGAWLAAVLLIPRVRQNRAFAHFFTLPQLYGHFFGRRVALLAGIISAIGYTGFTSSQMLAGAKLASGTFAGLELLPALLIMGVLAVVYTVMGGIKAVIYTDTVQWIILMAGLLFIGLPVCYYAVGGWAAIQATLPPHFFSFSNIGWVQLLNWAITIIPIWFVGMTLYQRIFACRNEQSAKKAWFIAGLFEWPIMALMGVSLGLLSRVAAEQGMFAYMGLADAGALDAEQGLPLLLRTVLPVGLMGLMMSAYFSAILSTADSCLMAASGNVVTDLIGNLRKQALSEKGVLRLSQWITLGIGVLALGLASFMHNVLSLMLYSYAFMVSGLLVPLVAALFFGSRHGQAAFWAMLVGGSLTVVLTVLAIPLPYSLDANLFGLLGSLITYCSISTLRPLPVLHQQAAA
ncbi:sodium:solute symporter family protein [Cesiribacter andamanensis]|uniref:Propionate transporter n=1 Tax=Cesiribacter andamanensis AMV16 TaxID=1279009 RepID=M7NCC6_9BACT|nr:sodium:solute symporter family protein [Cesiribacter andamanensis]EMR04801.1 Propionate transporter [Cesiribacter andamanensis AMV16]